MVRRQFEAFLESSGPHIAHIEMIARDQENLMLHQITSMQFPTIRNVDAVKYSLISVGVGQMPSDEYTWT